VEKRSAFATKVHDTPCYKLYFFINNSMEIATGKLPPKPRKMMGFFP
jgi:hypothetical protein